MSDRCIAVLASGLILAAMIFLGGCQAVGALAQAEEYQKLIDMPPRYAGLEGKTVAVVVQTDMATMYEYPSVMPSIADGVSRRIARDVPGAQVLGSQFVINWQYRTPQ